MNINPVSFGKAVRVNGSTNTAYDIARLANEKKASKAERSAQKEAKAIFDDVKTAPAQVVTYKNIYNKDEVYIVSGNESKKLDKLNDQIATGIIQAGDALDDEHKFKTSMNRQMNHHNQKVKNLLLDSATNYDIDATYDASRTRIKSVDRIYDSVYAVAGTKDQISELQNIFSKTTGQVMVMSATDLYTQGRTTGLCTDAASKGKEIAFVVTGKKSCDNVSFMNFGWSSLQGISKRIQSFINLENVKEQTKQIQEAMEYDYKKGN